MTFVEQSDGEGERRRERSLVRERAREIEERLGKQDEEDDEAIMESSMMSKKSEGGFSIRSERGKEEEEEEEEGGEEEEDSMVKSGVSAIGSSTGGL